MHTTVDIYVKDGDPLNYRLITDLPGGASALRLYVGADRHAISTTEVVVGPRNAVALHALLGEAIEEWRRKLGDRWAEEFPPTLDLGSEAA